MFSANYVWSKGVRKQKKDPTLSLFKVYRSIFTLRVDICVAILIYSYCSANNIFKVAKVFPLRLKR